LHILWLATGSVEREHNKAKWALGSAPTNNAFFAMNMRATLSQGEHDQGTGIKRTKKSDLMMTM
jgi:hypothetical protein